MILNYLLVAFRNMNRQKAYTFINLFGLAVGITTCILILLYVNNELSYDKYLNDHERIYRVSRAWYNVEGEESLHLGHVAPPFCPLLKVDYPQEIEEAVRFRSYSLLVASEEKQFEESDFFFADVDFLKVFSWQVIKGNPNTMLNQPNSILLSQSIAKKYFGDEEALNQTLTVDGEFEMKVTGIIQDIPENSHFHPAIIANIKVLEQFYGGPEQFMSAWGSNNFATYLKLFPEVDADAFEDKLSEFIDRHLEPGDYGAASKFNKLHLMNIADIHLHSHLDSEIEQNGDIAFIYLFAIIAAFILAIACINYINLSTARSAKRAREVGIRKVLGAFKRKLIFQFLTESMLVSILSLLTAIVLVALLLPWFNDFTQRELSFNILRDPFLLSLLLIITLVTGIFSGLYPALFLSSFTPAKVLKTANEKGGKAWLRATLVVFQFFISIVMLIGVGVVNDQLSYLKSKDLGFEKDRLLVLPSSDIIREKYEIVKNRLLEQEGIENVAFSSRIPSGRLLDSQGGAVEVEGEMKALDFRLADIHTDFDFLATMGIPIIAGRDFDPMLSSDSSEAFVINESAVAAIGYSNNVEAIGKKINYSDRKGYITGVVKDFHFESLRQEIAPMIFMITNGRGGQLVLKLDDNNEEETMKYLREQWSYLRPGFPFSYYYVDEEFNQLYEEDEMVSELVSYFSIVAIIIGVLGLFGLASYTAEQRFKEIGIRKVMGASVSQILLLLTKGYTLLVLISFVAAIPVAWYFMNMWLESFAYHGAISLLSILTAGIAAILIAWITVGAQTFKAARTNPADSLRSE